MKKVLWFAILAVILAVILAGCGDLQYHDLHTPTPPPVSETPILATDTPVSTEALPVSPTPILANGAPVSCEVTAESLHVREQGYYGSRVLGYKFTGDTVTVSKTKRGWAYIGEGWVKAEFLACEK